MNEINWKKLINENYDEIIEEGNKAYNGILEGNDMNGDERKIFLDENGKVHHYCIPRGMNFKFDDERKFITIISLDCTDDFLVEEDYTEEYTLSLRKEKIQNQIEEVLSNVDENFD